MTLDFKAGDLGQNTKYSLHLQNSILSESAALKYYPDNTRENIPCSQIIGPWRGKPLNTPMRLETTWLMKTIINTNWKPNWKPVQVVCSKKGFSSTIVCCFCRCQSPGICFHLILRCMPIKHITQQFISLCEIYCFVPPPSNVKQIKHDMTLIWDEDGEAGWLWSLFCKVTLAVKLNHPINDRLSVWCQAKWQVLLSSRFWASSYLNHTNTHASFFITCQLWISWKFTVTQSFQIAALFVHFRSLTI